MDKKLTQISGPIRCEFILGDPRYVRNIEKWSFYSTVVDDWCDAPSEFVHDTESVPIVTGSNREAGTGHDLTCRSDFITREKKISPTKLQSARIYLELQRHFDRLERKQWKSSKWQDWALDQPNRLWDLFKRGGKTAIVIVVPGYFHKHKVMATFEEMSGKKEPQKEA